MDATNRKKIAVIAIYADEVFSETDWYTLGQIAGRLGLVQGHPRLLRSLSFGDDDYRSCVAEVLNQVFQSNEESIDVVIDHFDIELWYQQKEPEKYRKLFLDGLSKPPEFWKDGYLRVFLSHLTENKARMSQLKVALESWGVTAFVAHEDIQPAKEWQIEVEGALQTMDILVALVEPGFRESEWCAQEVGFALGRRVEVMPLNAGMEPFGFFGKYQWIDVKGKRPTAVAHELIWAWLRKPKFRTRLLHSIGRALADRDSGSKLGSINELAGWEVASDEELKVLLETVSLSPAERVELKPLITKVKAFQSTKTTTGELDDIPF